MKKITQLRALLVMLMMCVGMSAWAVDATLTFSAQGYSNAQTVSSGTIDEFTSWSSEDGSTATAYYNTGSGLRIYNGGTFTVTSSKIIKSITLTFSAENYTFSSSNTNTSQTVNPNATSRMWTVSRTCRLQKVEVTYGDGVTPTLGLGGTSLDFGTVNQNDAVEAKTISATLSNVSSATVSLSGTGAGAFSIDKTSLTANGDITVTPNTATAGTYEATLSLSATGATTVSKTISMTVVAPFNGTVTTMSSDNDADIKFVTGSSSASGAVWATSTPLTANDVTLSGGVTSGTNYSYYDGSVVRFYANNSLVITPENGVTIVKVEIVRQSTTSSNTGTINCSGLTASTGNTTTNTNVYTGAATSAVTFTNSAQARFTSIIVYTTGGKTLQSVAVSGTPTKTTYVVGDSFDPTGLTVTGSYDEGDPEVITKGITWSTPAPLTAGQTSVEITATVNNITSASYTVTGLNVKYISSISVTGTPATFWKGDTFNNDGMTVTATYSDDSNEDVTNKASFTGYDMATAGTQTVTVTYGDQTDTYDITVQTIANTQETAYTTTQAKALIDAGKDLSTEVYVTGVVSKVDSYNDSHKSITYWLDDNSFEIYGGLAAVGDEFSSVDDIEVGATVTVLGNITIYKGTYEVNANNHLVSYTAPTPAPVTGTLTLAASNEDGYWATFSSTEDVIFDANDIVAYTVSVDDGSLVMIDVNNNSLSCVTDKSKDGGWVAGYYVQAGAAVLINSLENSVNYYYIDTDPYTANDLNDVEIDPEYNMLRPASVAKEATGYMFYKLAYASSSKDALGFYWGAANGAAFTSREGSAYLAVPNGSGVKGYSFTDAETAIKNVETKNVSNKTFNLQGQRVNAAQKGIYIMNGRKVVK